MITALRVNNNNNKAFTVTPSNTNNIINPPKVISPSINTIRNTIENRITKDTQESYSKLKMYEPNLGYPSIRTKEDLDNAIETVKDLANKYRKKIAILEAKGQYRSLAMIGLYRRIEYLKGMLDVLSWLTNESRSLDYGEQLGIK